MRKESPWRPVRLTIAILLVGGAIAFSVLSGDGPPVGRQAPAIEAERLNGEAFSLSDLRGRVVVLDFWATWCPPCQKSLPALQRVHERYKDDAGVFIASINTDHPVDQKNLLGRFMKARRYSFPVVLDDGAKAVSNAYRVQSIPTLVIIDADGVVRKVERGIPSSKVDVIEAHLNALIADLRP
jgi:cytochrome c biogenesis protein CcmG, thiol:disulfide interchange protein DsbE